MADKLTPLEEGLLRALRAIDNQIDREMQRSPAELEKLGVQKWEPFNKRIENISAFLIDRISEQDIQLESLVVAAQAFSKVMKIFAEDLGEAGLGKMRSAYLRWAMENLSRDSYEALRALGAEGELT